MLVPIFRDAKEDASRDFLGAVCQREEIGLMRDWLRRHATLVAIAGFLGVASGTSGAMAATNDYPTVARVDYVVACMAVNGKDYLVMQKCSCSLDYIAERIPYETYERIETIMRMREGRGELALMFRTSRALEDEVQSFRRAQVEADLQCF